MKLYIQLAWRNLWRNKRRTLIAVSSVFFAVFFSVVMRSMQKGSYDYMIYTSVSTFTGYIQVHGKEFWDKRSLDQSMTIEPSIVQQFRKIPHVTAVVPRLESFSLISYGSATKVASVVGIDPEHEDQMTNLKSKLTSGTYLADTSQGILLAEGLAKVLKVSVGDSIVLYGQGFQGTTAAALMPVTGVVKFNLPNLNTSLIYISLPTAQWLFSAPDRITSLSFMIDNIRHLKSTTRNISALTDSRYEVMTWDKMMPELVQYIEADNSSGIIMLLILYVVIGFGIFATVMMLTNERIREYGVLISVGMKKARLIFVTILETIFISFMGVISGSIASLPIIFYYIKNPIVLTGKTAEVMLSFGFEPILPFNISAGMFLEQIYTVLIIALFSAIYPYVFIRKLKPVKALRG
ncbi:MAG: ABC transporter permease [Candidatus Marinimicrobia bacterium]|nr:ABC transporter permease [Candidatus Neomarinimicrobiota bacterium]